jgi:hypothetical protein
VSREAKKQKNRCADCKFVDTSKGHAQWSCGSPRAHAETRNPLPKFFPRVFTNDVCAHWVDGRPPAPPVIVAAAEPEPEP